LTATENAEILAEAAFDLWSLHAELGDAAEAGRFRLAARDGYRRLLAKTPKREYQDRLAALDRATDALGTAGPATG
jgi:hypothetical protein